MGEEEIYQDVYLGSLERRHVQLLDGMGIARSIHSAQEGLHFADVGDTRQVHYAAGARLQWKVPETGGVLGAEKIKRENFLEFDEATALVEAAGYNPEWQGMILFALRTGVRYGELCELRWSDIDFDRQVVTISRSFHRGNVGPCKSGVDRVVDFSPENLQMLRSLKHLKGPLVFCKEDGGRHIHRRADVALKRCAARAGIERSIGWHTLRHTFASHLTMKNIPMRSIQELLGHASLDMTLRYAHLARGVNREAVAQLDESHRETGHKFRASGGPEA